MSPFLNKILLKFNLYSIISINVPLSLWFSLKLPIETNFTFLTDLFLSSFTPFSCEFAIVFVFMHRSQSFI